ncbi:hypothetical protein LV716_13855 [Flagellimonas sp. HMM57]|uniref:hypothetical protein n=1 Tax=unclassified Flagellimonas TaxID=2644544 RepID=UPI0013D30D62|nr:MULTISPECIES: hypothetical protein [unclassified Flagellimonas]UII75332.1 hypothetical protein LV716_13855 [Flagellimonas sp. HMM57]
MRNIVCLILLFVFGKVLSQEVVIENDSLLLWQADRSLTWKDFKGKQLNYHGNVLAEIFGEIKTIGTKWSANNTPIFTVGVFMDKCSSWTITDDLESLEHEQIHFHIFELSARRIRKKFAELSKNGVSDVTVYQEIFGENLQMNKQLHKEYDIDVVTDQKKQLEWKVKVLKELEELREYEYIPEE